MRVLVTGGAGFIGRGVVGALLRRGDFVTALDDLSNGSEANVAEFRRQTGFHFQRGDVADAAAVSAAFRDANRCIHLAAIIEVQRSIDDPRRTHQVNITGTLNVLEECRKRDVPLTVVSTCMVYDRANTPDGIGETHPTKPASPYAASKLSGEALTLSYHHAFGLPTTVVRPFNTYGPFQRSVGEGGVVAIFTRCSLLGEDLRIYGDGTQTRDLLYVEDCARFVCDALVSDAVIGGIVNAGTGVDVSVNELAALVQPDPSRIVHVPHIHPQSEIAVLRCDSRVARRVLGWVPEVSLVEGLARTREWMAERLALGLPVA